MTKTKTERPTHYECVNHGTPAPCIPCEYNAMYAEIYPAYRPRKPQESPPNDYDISDA